MSKRITETRMKARRAQVSTLILAGERSVRSIARKLNTSPATICRDIQAIEKEWADEVDPADRERHRINELKKLDQMERAIATASVGFKEADLKKAEIPERDVDLAMTAQHSRLNLMKRRARLLGLDSETLNVRNLTPSDVLKAMRERAAKREELSPGDD